MIRVCIYSIDNSAIFDPIDFNEIITPLSIRKTFYDKNDSYMTLFMALKRNEKALIVEIIENIDPCKPRMNNLTVESRRILSKNYRILSDPIWWFRPGKVRERLGYTFLFLINYLERMGTVTS